MDSDRNQIFSGAYISFLTFFESQIEDLFIGLLTGKFMHPDKTVTPLVAMPNSKVAKSVIQGTRAYADWLPFEGNTLKRASALFADGRPFSSLTRPQITALSTASILRNALAHQSDHSQRQFNKKFTDGHALRTSELRPGGYLRGNHSFNRTRLEVQLSELVAIMGDLTK